MLGERKTMENFKKNSFQKKEIFKRRKWGHTKLKGKKGEQEEGGNGCEP